MNLVESIFGDDLGEIEGLEGPFHFRDGRTLYYDPVQGRYYDRKTDLYLEVDDLPGLNEDIKRKGGKWIVTNKSGDKILGTHDTKAEAEAQLTAIHISKAQLKETSHSKSLTGYSPQEAWDIFIGKIRAGEGFDEIQPWYDELLRMDVWQYALDAAISTDGRAAPKKPPSVGRVRLARGR
jgi:hypothetical protein